MLSVSQPSQLAIPIIVLVCKDVRLKEELSYMLSGTPQDQQRDLRLHGRGREPVQPVQGTEPPPQHTSDLIDLSLHTISQPAVDPELRSGVEQSDFFRERLRKRPLHQTLKELVVAYKDCYRLCWDLNKELSLKIVARSLFSTASQVAARYAFFVMAVATKEAGSSIWPLWIAASLLISRFQSRQDTLIGPETKRLGHMARLAMERQLGSIPDRASHRELREDFPSTFAYLREKVEGGTVETLIQQAFSAPGLVLGLTSAIGAISFVDWRIGVLGMLSVWPYFWLQNKHARQTLELEVKTRHQEELGNAASRAAYSLESLQLVQGGLHKALSQQYVERVQDVWQARDELQIAQARQMSLLDYGYYAVITLAGCAFFKFSPSIGVAVFLTDQLRQFMYEFYVAGSEYEDRVMSARLASDLNALDQKHTDTRTDPFPESWDITLEPTVFEIIGADRGIVLNNEILIPQGSLVRLSGETGAGKTTFLDYLSHGASGVGGEVKIGGAKIDNIQRSALTGSLVRVNSTPSFIRGFTIRDFLTFGNHRIVSEDQILAVLSEMHLLEDVLGFKDGLNSIIGSEYRGVDCSEGQVQRLGLARALLMKPKILLLDEALNHLDSKTKSEILGVIARYNTEGTTVMMVEHQEDLKVSPSVHLHISKADDGAAEINRIYPS